MVNKLILLLLFFLIAASASSKADTVYWSTGEIQSVISKENERVNHISYHKNGNKNEEGTLQNGIRIDEWRKYYPSGKIECITSYVQGTYEYSYSSYYESNQLKSKGTFKNGIDYTHQSYYETGVLKLSLETLDNGERIRKEFYNNGNILEEGTFKNNIRIGEWRHYYPSGQIEHMTSYLKGDAECSYSSYYENNQLKSKGTVKNGVDYEYQSYYETGVLQTSLETLDNGERVNKVFYRSGTLKQIGTYAPLRNGTWKTFYESGELKRTEEFSNGQMVGIWKEYYINKKLKQTEECIPNTMYRDIKEYHLNGKIKAIGRAKYSYVDSGQKIGSWKEYHDNGVLYKSYQFEDVSKTGYWRTYHKNGSLQEQGLYEADKPMGMWEEFYDNGQLKNTGKYAENLYRMEKQGLWKTYHKNGQLKRTASHYYRGVDGEAREYYRNGSLRCIEKWSCDKAYGKWEYYRRNGKHLKSEDHGAMGC
jgi:antitoxin component YwqK of YwqJK toxin-antitoxin module